MSKSRFYIKPFIIAIIFHQVHLINFKNCSYIFEKNFLVSRSFSFFSFHVNESSAGILIDYYLLYRLHYINNEL